MTILTTLWNWVRRHSYIIITFICLGIFTTLILLDSKKVEQPVSTQNVLEIKALKDSILTLNLALDSITIREKQNDITHIKELIHVGSLPDDSLASYFARRYTTGISRP